MGEGSSASTSLKQSSDCSHTRAVNPATTLTLVAVQAAGRWKRLFPLLSTCELPSEILCPVLPHTPPLKEIQKKPERVQQSANKILQAHDTKQV